MTARACVSDRPLIGTRSGGGNAAFGRLVALRDLDRPPTNKGAAAAELAPASQQLRRLSVAIGNWIAGAGAGDKVDALGARPSRRLISEAGRPAAAAGQVRARANWATGGGGKHELANLLAAGWKLPTLLFAAAQQTLGWSHTVRRRLLRRLRLLSQATTAAATTCERRIQRDATPFNATHTRNKETIKRPAGRGACETRKPRRASRRKRRRPLFAQVPQAAGQFAPPPPPPANQKQIRPARRKRAPEHAD